MCAVNEVRISFRIEPTSLHAVRTHHGGLHRRNVRVTEGASVHPYLAEIHRGKGVVLAPMRASHPTMFHIRRFRGWWRPTGLINVGDLLAGASRIASTRHISWLVNQVCLTVFPLFFFFVFSYASLKARDESRKGSFVCPPSKREKKAPRARSVWYE